MWVTVATHIADSVLIASHKSGSGRVPAAYRTDVVRVSTGKCGAGDENRTRVSASEAALAHRAHTTRRRSSLSARPKDRAQSADRIPVRQLAQDQSAAHL